MMMIQKIKQYLKKLTLQDVVNVVILIDTLQRWFN